MPWLNSRSSLYSRMAAADEHTLRHLASYLKAAEQDARLQQLLVGTRNWLDAKAGRFGTDTEYMEDLALAIGAPRDVFVSETELLDIASFHAARLVVYSRINRYTYDAVEALVWLGREKEAIRLTQLRPRSVSGAIISSNRTGARGAASMEGQAVLGLIRIYHAGYLRDTRLSSWLLTLHNEILAMVRATPEAENRDEAAREFIEVLMETGQYDSAGLLYTVSESSLNKQMLAKDLIRMYSEAGQFDRAEMLLLELDHSSRQDALGIISAGYARACRFDQAITIMELLTDDWRKTYPRRCLAVAYASQGAFREVEKILSRFNTNDIKIEEMCAFAKSAFTHGDVKRTSSWLQAISDAIPKLPEIYDWSTAEEQRCLGCLEYARLLKVLSAEDEARSMVWNAAEYAFACPDSHQVRQSTLALLTTMGCLGFHDDLTSTLSRTPSHLRDWFQANVAAAVATSGQLGFAEALAYSVKGGEARQHALLALSVAKAKKGQMEEASRHFDDAIEAARRTEETAGMVQTLCAVSRALADCSHESASPILTLALETLKRARRDIDSPQTNEQPLSWAFTSSFLRDAYVSEIKLIAIELVRQDRVSELLELTPLLTGVLFLSTEEHTLIRKKLMQWKTTLTPSKLDIVLGMFSLECSARYDIQGISRSERIALLKRKLMEGEQAALRLVPETISSLISELASSGEFDEAQSLLVKYRATLDEHGFAEAVRILERKLILAGHIDQAERLVNGLTQLAGEHYSNRKALWAAREELVRFYVETSRYEQIRNLTEGDGKAYEQTDFAYMTIDCLAESGAVDLAQSLLNGLAVEGATHKKQPQALVSIASALAKQGNVNDAAHLFRRAIAITRSQHSWGGGLNPDTAVVLEASAGAGMFGTVLSNHPFEVMGDFIQMIAGWGSGLRLLFGVEAERIHARLLHDITRIASWDQIEWLKVNELVSVHGVSKAPMSR
jgi:tetratricopeptide (TPR) repeat protein